MYLYAQSMNMNTLDECIFGKDTLENLKLWTPHRSKLKYTFSNTYFCCYCAHHIGPDVT